MGQTLSEPVLDKHSSSGGDRWLHFGVSHMQGWRISMEDAHCALLNFTDSNSSNPPTSFFGVFDGHGGDRVAKYCRQHLPDIIKSQPSFWKGNYDEALKSGFLAADNALMQDRDMQEDPSGCTATTALIVDHQVIYCANAGDSRTVLGRKGTAEPLSFDHKPNNDVEKARITAAGGFIDFGRVNGSLALSRAIGDFEYKKDSSLPPEKQIVTAFPDVVIHNIDPDDEFLILACDGIWDCKSSQQVVEFVRRGIVARQSLEVICENLMDRCIASNSESCGIGCDNMTICIVAFLHGRGLEDWYNWITQRVNSGEGPCAPPSYAELRGPNTIADARNLQLEYDHIASHEYGSGDTYDSDSDDETIAYDRYYLH
ncbi:serine/threonine protein phosphatase PP2C catalytic subunit Ptc2 [Schizosaccharomyces pombe]|uniref:Protein phosphatase 2C homolog 2 n=1 Tax=Schizosaccharomyces pombe (strain 972 / ATCC 24843) TaxID=284812 RepID=PP2C2_SCHPO|nr:protein phosphatase 2C Ptc2 [Schizosaccharomyces pombe]Q09172.1 RecName: Full=Protein phosphatase 2C homolog 2; Short=PP2C-2 [Schizosaccharomyces pombe 972h-]AAA67320.1 protein phosphatase 2C (ptc2+) [Schizosaccharomyces pombe]CAA20880.1 protein phosphatase 2C Ptc2 [Schizosaccharomyces pombe]|eukprot:NP_588356.1 protein phosphatase 2C Ptc2 [Schizosaccharomyces pombe]